MSGSRRATTGMLGALAASVGLHLAGSGVLQVPPTDSWAALDAWYVERGSATAVVALVRLLAFGASCWLVIVSGLQLLAGRVRRAGFSAVIDRISPPSLRALSRHAAGLSVTAGLALPLLPASTMQDPPGTAVMVPLDVPPSTSSTTTAPATTSTTTATAPTTAPPSTVEPAAPPPAVAPVGQLTPSAAFEEVIVAEGDSFWSIAVEEAGQRELIEYWEALIEANRDRLVDRENPDLLYPGQVLRLP